ncbi:MAG: helix-turn-helix transcriptional regulator [Clostridia bacterium]|nr:helix-turn-helix transcriptional regulator [Clostridia bacterium]
MNAYPMPTVDFFTVSRYEYETSAVCDFSDCPRPHFCMGLILEGTADFTPVYASRETGSPVTVSRGDIIFVPITSRYISKWTGTPRIRYISYHFTFAPGTGISESNNFTLQKITPQDFEALRAVFEYAHAHYGNGLSEQLQVLSAFYALLSRLLPSLSHAPERKYDERIRRAVDYIRLHSEEDISIPTLATMCNISTSHFYTKFKEEVGMTPVDYKNSILVSRATTLLLHGDFDSIEAISDALGFASATYFRRVFKKITGKSPSEYRKTAAEL